MNENKVHMEGLNGMDSSANTESLIINQEEDLDCPSPFPKEEEFSMKVSNAATIEVNSDAAKRKLVCQRPEVLKVGTLDELLKFLEASQILKLAMEQLIIKFRAFVRQKMESVNPDKTPKYSDADIKDAPEILDWKPSFRVALSATERARKKVDALSQEDVKLVILNNKDMLLAHGLITQAMYDELAKNE